MIHTISNAHLAISVNTEGAELCSLVRKTDNEELLWQGDAQYWNGQSPILFPTVGNSYEQTIRHEGKSYPMPKHGLVRSMDFTLIEQTADRLTLCVESNEETRLHYPFPFRLTVCYALHGHDLEITFRITNPGESRMPFLLGAHPGFRLPDFHAEDKVHGYLGFNVADKLVSLGLKPGGFVWREGSFDVPLNEESMLPLTNTTFECDTILDDTNRLRSCSLYGKDERPVVSLRFDAPVLALWAPCGGCAPFVCIEPWWGLCDEFEYRGEFGQRPWANTVESQASKDISYTITVH